MLNVYGDMRSGNCYKIKLLLSFLDIQHHWIHIDILEGQTQSPEFKAKNPNGKIPLVELDDGVFLSESNAILNYFAQDTRFLPDDALARARVLEWQFFEQYSHEPYIAVARYINLYLGLPEARRAEYESKQLGGHKALLVMESQLAKTNYLTGDDFTIADISLFAYTHVAHEGGFNLSEYPSINRWLNQIKAIAGFVPMS